MVFNIEVAGIAAAQDDILLEGIHKVESRRISVSLDIVNGLPVDLQIVHVQQEGPDTPMPLQYCTSAEHSIPGGCGRAKRDPR